MIFCCVSSVHKPRSKKQDDRNECACTRVWKKWAKLKFSLCRSKTHDLGWCERFKATSLKFTTLSRKQHNIDTYAKSTDMFPFGVFGWITFNVQREFLSCVTIYWRAFLFHFSLWISMYASERVLNILRELATVKYIIFKRNRELNDSLKSFRQSRAGEETMCSGGENVASFSLAWNICCSQSIEQFSRAHACAFHNSRCDALVLE